MQVSLTEKRAVGDLYQCLSDQDGDGGIQSLEAGGLGSLVLIGIQDWEINLLLQVSNPTISSGTVYVKWRSHCRSSFGRALGILTVVYLYAETNMQSVQAG